MATKHVHLFLLRTYPIKSLPWPEITADHPATRSSRSRGHPDREPEIRCAKPDSVTSRETNRFCESVAYARLFGQYFLGEFLNIIYDNQEKRKNGTEGLGILLIALAGPRSGVKFLISPFNHFNCVS